jgi:hypothetical protein
MLTGALVITDWQGVTSYLVQRRMESKLPTGSWMGEEEPDPQGTRGAIKAVAWIWAGFGALLVVHVLAHLIAGR